MGRTRDLPVAVRDLKFLELINICKETKVKVTIQYLSIFPHYVQQVLHPRIITYSDLGRMFHEVNSKFKQECQKSVEPHYCK